MSSCQSQMLDDKLLAFGDKKMLNVKGNTFWWDFPWKRNLRQFFDRDLLFAFGDEKCGMHQGKVSPMKI